MSAAWQDTAPFCPDIGEVWHHGRFGTVRFTRFDLSKQDGWRKDETVFGWAYVTGRPNTIPGLSGDLAIVTNEQGAPKHMERAEGGWFGPIPPKM